MKKDVLVSISGLQYEIDKEEAVEVISVGEYYNRNGKHYVVYEEILEDMEGTTNCTIKIAEKQIDIIKRGASNVHMVFEENTKNTTYYQTPYGELQVGIYTTQIKVTEEENKIIANINYGLDINYAFISDCQIQLKISSKKMGSDTL
ncbi:DUF1934 domain-containing protein [Anaerocolumna sp. AGMB13025]|uniref:DUF1934 domain-containing protein n=1 Tax=Anaerocolumna sp. AGMB13025 TaxID=3039116 RepID=UPI0024201585|nr:DUF1934 domain-containing protein [Anaerocolumna sp. AGMB13025]WFR57378.1 DUF1934 domain-containing protein [Anaerocolumna sp. AGMB13025]